MDLQLGNRTALVTGASRGLGRAIAFKLAGEGVKTAIVARRGELLRESGTEGIRLPPMSPNLKIIVHLLDLYTCFFDQLCPLVDLEFQEFTELLGRAAGGDKSVTC